ncbi:MAG: AAA family ATPase, partial [Planctomycetes bacterium]|nr:AAA family ATPase [Planctomycetota bacterium]
PNGSGKSNLYRALRLLADSADGRLAHSLAREGGFSSVLWAGPETISREMITHQVPVQGTARKKPISLKLGFTADPLSYSLDLGLPQPSDSMFDSDPEMKRECLWRGPQMDARSLCADRRRSSLRCRSEKGAWRDIDLPLSPQTSMLAEYADPFAAPELILMRDILRSWRFYDSFRTDSDSPARRTSIGTFTPVMSGDGSDLPAALQTILEIGDADDLVRAVDDAFPGSLVRITPSEAGLRLSLAQPGMLRELSAAELSDGTLRFLLLAAALLTPRPPELMVLNEPENSLHQDLIPALSRLIATAAERSQIIVVSHNQSLVDALESDECCVPIRLQKRLGETIIESANLLDQHGWKWPPR